MEVRVEVEAGVDEVDAHALADLHVRRVLAGQGSLGAVEDDVGGVLVGEGLPVGDHRVALVGARHRVELGLDHVQLVVDRRQGLGGVDEDAAVHALGDVHRHVAEGAVVHEEAGVEQPRLDASPSGPARPSVSAAPPPCAGHGVEVDVVGHRVVAGLVSVKRRTSPTRARIMGPGVPRDDLVVARQRDSPRCGTGRRWPGRCWRRPRRPRTSTSTMAGSVRPDGGGTFGA